MMRTAAVLILLAGLALAAQTPSPPPDDEYPTLPAGPGRELVIRVCSKCHQPDKAAGEQLELAEWKTLVDQMADQGADATEEEFAAIVQYLAKAFPPAK